MNAIVNILTKILTMTNVIHRENMTIMRIIGIISRLDTEKYITDMDNVVRDVLNGKEVGSNAENSCEN